MLSLCAATISGASLQNFPRPKKPARGPAADRGSAPPRQNYLRQSRAVLQHFRAVLPQRLLAELDSEAGCVVEIENALLDARFAIVDFEPEGIAVGIGERFQNVAV